MSGYFWENLNVMITICVLFAAKGTIKEKAYMLMGCIVCDCVYLVPVLF